MTTVTTPTTRVVRAPTISRLSSSRPSWSVPSRFDPIRRAEAVGDLHVLGVVRGPDRRQQGSADDEGDQDGAGDQRGRAAAAHDVARTRGSSSR